ncbi:hypothetical protein [Halobellus captivus]|uniref:hypothetical protein n=1 Tax=Halobellus captivus TaxID=2592614 RepID=UPI0011A49FB0|nr:hypothetical protein [Halobellus captivus]
MTTLNGGTFRLKRPEYTGENRCLPCTAINVAITALVAAAVGAVWIPLGVAAAGIGLAAIYFRGYLVPGTPTLTKRYLPERIHRLFGTHHDSDVDLDAGAIEETLLSLSVLEPCDERADDLCLTPRFRESWHEQSDRIDADTASVSRLFSGLDTDLSELTTERRANAFVATTGSMTLAKWESDAAFVADVAADTVLRERSTAWANLNPEPRLELLGALRLWLERCPSCAGRVALDEETVESCCRSYEVVAATCNDCEARLFEARLSPGAASDV